MIMGTEIKKELRKRKWCVCIHSKRESDTFHDAAFFSSGEKERRRVGASEKKSADRQNKLAAFSIWFLITFTLVALLFSSACFNEDIPICVFSHSHRTWFSSNFLLATAFAYHLAFHFIFCRTVCLVFIGCHMHAKTLASARHFLSLSFCFNDRTLLCSHDVFFFGCFKCTCMKSICDISHNSFDGFYTFLSISIDYVRLLT